MMVAFCLCVLAFCVLSLAVVILYHTIRWVIRHKAIGLTLVAACIVIGEMAWDAAFDYSTIPDRIASTVQIDIPMVATKCSAYSEGFEDTIVYLRCDVPADQSAGWVAAADWARPIHYPDKTTGRSEINSIWLCDRGLPPWRDPEKSMQWIAIPQTQVGVSDGTNGEPIYNSMLIDITDPVTHRVFMMH